VKVFRSAVVMLAMCLGVVGCSDDGGAGPLPGGARTYYESLELGSPVAAAATFTDAFARDDFMTVWLVLDAQAQFAFQQYVNLIEYDGLIRSDAIEGDLAALLQEAWAVDNPDRSIDAWYLFDQVMLIADRHDAFSIDLSGEAVFGVAEPGNGYSDVPAEVEGIDGEVVFRVTGSEGDRWRVHQVIVPGGDEERIPWSVPGIPSGEDPSWCVLAWGRDDSHGPAVTDLSERLEDPRADDPAWVYLESQGDAVAVPGPEVDAALLDPEAVRGFQRIGLDDRNGTLGLLVAGVPGRCSRSRRLRA
jgi:hypothetical protein